MSGPGIARSRPGAHPALGSPQSGGRVERIGRAALLFLAILALVVPDAANAAPGRADFTVKVSDGYARFVFTLDEDVDTNVRMAGSVLIINFSKATFVAVDRLIAQAPDYVSAARLDPDRRAMRFALARKVKVNTITVGEKFFVDLLPDTWTGPPPGLPQEVVEDLARRTREAERLERLQHPHTAKKPPNVRVHVANLPTFVRYVFDVPELTEVSSDRAKDRLTLTFGTPIAFDLADVEAALPPAVASINAEVEQDSTLVRFSFLSQVDVRTFRDDKGYVVDIVRADSKVDASGEAVRQKVLKAAGLETGPGEPPPNARAVEGAAAMPEKPDGAAHPTTTVQRNAPAVTPLAAPPPSQAQAKAEAPAPSAGAEAKRVPTEPAATPESATAPAKAEPPAPSAGAEAKRVPTATPESAAAPAKAGPPAPSVAPAAARQTPAEPATAVQSAAPAPAKAEPPSKAIESDTPQPAPAADRSSSPARVKTGDGIAAEMSRQDSNLKLFFPFPTATAAAVFQRADTLWIVFDATTPIDLAALDRDTSHVVRSTELIRLQEAEVLRLRLDRPHLSSAAVEGTGWIVTIGVTIFAPTHPLELARNTFSSTNATVSIPFEEPHLLHRIRDPDAGDDLVVVTGFAPARGLLNEQDFVEFRALGATQGVVVEPLADDLKVELAPAKVVVSRPGGLTLSSSLHSALGGSGLRPAMFDSQLWGLDRDATYMERQAHLIDAAAAAPEGKRVSAELDLARFYLARNMYHEAKGVLDVALSRDHSPSAEVTGSVLRAATEVMMNRPDDALRDLARPAIGDQLDAPLWRALAYSHQGKWSQARAMFKTVEAAVATLPVELERTALADEMRAAIEVGDFATAADQLNDLETVGLPRELQPEISVLIGRLSEGLGRKEDALAAYQTAADSWDRPAAAQGQLREIALRYALGDLKREDVISQLETLTTIWRGDDTEVEALKILARLYTEEGRYRDSFYVMRSAIAANPESDMTRRIQNDAAATFDALFLAGKGDALPTVDALALFYDFRELAPIGRRGDEMIRRLADRLVSVDLLDQAAELLQYQIDRRLQGAARAQVATRLAVIYLINHKPDRALSTLQGSRSGDVANELRNQRLLLEARSLSDLKRPDLALEVVANLEGREVIRLRSDILWAARRWGPAAEQIELYYGDRWKDWRPLNEAERTDILRAAIGYALAEDALGLGRCREKYAAKMAQTSDAHAFDVVSAPLGTSGSEFRDIARAATSADTLEGFLRDMQARYPEASAMSPPPAVSPKPGLTDTAPLSSTPPQTRPAASTTPSPAARAKGRTAQR